MTRKTPEAPRSPVFPRSIFEAVSDASAMFVEPTEKTNRLEITVAALAQEHSISTTIGVEEAQALRLALGRWLREKRGTDAD